MFAQYRIFIVFIALLSSACAYANDGWILRIIEEGSPSRLVALLLYLKDQPRSNELRKKVEAKLAATFATPSVQVLPQLRVSESNAWNLVLPRDVLKIILRHMARSGTTLGDWARLRRVSKSFRVAVDDNMAASASYVVDSTSSLMLLMTLSEPMLRLIGHLRFQFGSCQILPASIPFSRPGSMDTGDLRFNFEHLLQEAGWNRATPISFDETILFAAIFNRYWPQFLTAHAAHLRQVVALQIEGSNPSDWWQRGPENTNDSLIIEELLASGLFPNLRILKVSRCGYEFRDVFTYFDRALPKLRELRLDRLLMSTPRAASAFVECVEAGALDELEVLHLQETQMEAELVSRLIGLARKGRLAQVQDFFMYNLVSNAAELIIPLAHSFPRLHTLRLSSSTCFVHFIEFARANPGFACLRNIDARLTWAQRFTELRPTALLSLFPALKELTLSLSCHMKEIAVLMNEPENLQFIELVEDVRGEPLQQNPQFALRILNIPPRIVRSRPGLAGILARLEERVVIEVVEEDDEEEDAELQVVNFAIAQAPRGIHACTLL